MNDMDYDTARHLAEKSVHDKYNMDNIVIYDKFSRKIQNGWLFIPADKEFIETGDIKYALINVGGFVVMKDGEQIYIPSSILFQDGVEQYVSEHRH